MNKLARIPAVASILFGGKLVEERVTRYSLLVQFYHRYLKDGVTARFISSVASMYMSGTLERILKEGEANGRRAAALSLGLIGDSQCIEHLGPLLRDNDRKLRLVVDDAMRAIGEREGTAEQRQRLERVIRSNECGTFEKSVDIATEAIDGNLGTVELVHQRSLAFFQLESINHAIADCRQVLHQHRFHYNAMVGLGHCHLELGDLMESLFWFRNALDVYPDLEPVRLQVKQLERAIQDL